MYYHRTFALNLRSLWVIDLWGNLNLGDFKSLIWRHMTDQSIVDRFLTTLFTGIFWYIPTLSTDFEDEKKRCARAQAHHSSSIVVGKFSAFVSQGRDFGPWRTKIQVRIQCWWCKKVNVSDYIQKLDCIRQDEVLLKESFLYLLYYSQSTVRYDNAYPMYLLCYV